jgi:hypothetical protein
VIKYWVVNYIDWHSKLESTNFNIYILSFPIRTDNISKKKKFT